MMRTEVTANGIEIASDGRYCWVNSPSGLMVARFGPRGHEVGAVIVPGPTDAASWIEWTNRVAASPIGVDVHDRHRPGDAGGDGHVDGEITEPLSRPVWAADPEPEVPSREARLGTALGVAVVACAVVAIALAAIGAL